MVRTAKQFDFLLYRFEISQANQEVTLEARGSYMSAAGTPMEVSASAGLDLHLSPFPAPPHNFFFKDLQIPLLRSLFTYYTRRPLVSALLIIVFLLSFLFIFTTAGAAGIALPPTVLYTPKPLYTATRKSA